MPTAREPELMRPMLAAAGITLNVQNVDAATRTQLLTEGNFQMALTSHIGVGGDPDYLRRWYAGEEANTFAQGSIFHNAQYTRLGEQEAATIDPPQRRAIVFQMQEILADELPTIVLYHRRFYWVYDPSVFTPMMTAGGLMNGIPFPEQQARAARHLTAADVACRCPPDHPLCAARGLRDPAQLPASRGCCPAIRSTWAPGEGLESALPLSAATREQLRAYYHLDAPLPGQFAAYLGDLAHGDLGWSIARSAPVSGLLLAPAALDAGAAADRAAALGGARHGAGHAGGLGAGQPARPLAGGADGGALGPAGVPDRHRPAARRLPSRCAGFRCWAGRRLCRLRRRICRRAGAPRSTSPGTWRCPALTLVLAGAAGFVLIARDVTAGITRAPG